MGAFDNLLGHVIDLKFNTHEGMIEAAAHWEIEEYQLDNGSFIGSMNAIHTSHIQIAHTFRSNGIFIKGKTPRNAYMFASVESEGKTTHNGLSIYADEFVVLTENDELDFTVSTAFNDVSISIDKEFFDEAFKVYFNEPFKYDTVNKRMQMKKNTEFDFRDSAKDVLHDMILQHTELTNNSTFHDTSEQAILEIIFQNIDHTRKRKKTLESEINADKIRKYIEKYYKDDIKVNALSDSNKFAKRTIRLGFTNLFGISPKQYLQCYRLGAIHHALLKNDFNTHSVGDIAYEHGFLHMGRFGDNYKSMFGKTPSSTLKTTL